jgi:nicotinate phosphoribosyltransferase
MNVNDPCPKPYPAEGAAGDELALLTDLYELTMLQAYFAEGMMEEAVFSLFVRRLPARRNFLLSCGLDTVLGYLEGLRFSEGDVAYLRSLAAGRVLPSS